MLFSDVWSENAALFERLVEIHSNPPILYFEFKAADERRLNMFEMSCLRRILGD